MPATITHPDNFDTINDLCFYFYNTLQGGEEYQAEITIHDNTMNFCIYRFDNLTINNETSMQELFNACIEADAPTQVLIGKNLKVEEGCTLQPPYRCKGLVLYFKGSVENAGLISMSCRGAVATPIDIYLYRKSMVVDGVPTVDYDYVPARGAAGIPPKRRSTSANSCTFNGETGLAGTKRQTGGGGTGAFALNGNNWSAALWSGASSAGTCYAGGNGGGAILVMNKGALCSYGYGDANAWAGGKAWARDSNTAASEYSLGGTGIQCGADASEVVSQVYGIWKYAGVGGLLIIFTPTLDNQGVINSNAAFMSHGSVRMTRTYNFFLQGGGAGGGSINIFTSKLVNMGQIIANGSTHNPNRPPTFRNSSGYCAEYYGGTGGNGCVTISKYTVTRFLIKDTDVKYYENNKWLIL